MTKHQLSAAQLRIILSVTLFIITGAAIAIALFAYGQLKTVAVEVSHSTIDAEASRNNIQALEQVRSKLAEEGDVVERAQNIVAESQSYLYQDQIIQDLKQYASRAGVEISSINFQAAQVAAQGQSAASTETVAGVKSTKVSVKLKSPMNFTKLLRFIKSIEQNLTKMQISKLSLSKSGTNQAVTSDDLTVEVYVK